MQGGSKPEKAVWPLASFLGAGVLGFGLMFVLKPVLDDAMRTNVDASGDERQSLALEAVETLEMPGFSRVSTPLWEVSTDLRDPHGGA